MWLQTLHTCSASSSLSMPTTLSTVGMPSLERAKKIVLGLVIAAFVWFSYNAFLVYLLREPGSIYKSAGPVVFCNVESILMASCEAICQQRSN